MRKRLHAARLSLFAAAVAAALGFGATAAMADAPPACPRLAVGRCNGLADCQATCASLGRDPAGARCDQDGGGQGCCYCPLIL